MQPRGLTRRDLEIGTHRVELLHANTALPGIPLVMLHGILASAECWLPTLPESVCRRRPWYALNLPGHGNSSPLPSEPTPSAEDFTQNLAGTIAQLSGGRPVAVLGWSTGGFAALHLAARHPRLVASAMSISGFASGRWHGTLGGLQRLSRVRLAGRYLFGHVLRSVATTRWSFGLCMRQMMGTRATRNDAAGRETVEILRRAVASHRLALLASLVAAFAQFDIRSLLPQITVPTYIVGGQLDPIIRPEQTRSLAERIPRARLHLLQDVGHFLLAEQPRLYQRLVEEWLRATDREVSKGWHSISA